MNVKQSRQRKIILQVTNINNNKTPITPKPERINTTVTRQKNHKFAPTANTAKDPQAQQTPTQLTYEQAITISNPY